ncbi:MAG: hypothetical protein QXI95_02435 [Candidatus Micrarchaeaceae archaeon]
MAIGYLPFWKPKEGESIEAKLIDWNINVDCGVFILKNGEKFLIGGVQLKNMWYGTGSDGHITLYEWYKITYVGKRETKKGYFMNYYEVKYIKDGTLDKTPN